ncbi:MAG: prepilin-type N-terminal cleavage/methylation domain-containing protein [Firmicutes bacterium]|nr:prepilin-type N-terminal cleavage/methylation domain-containing protein [Bacillota bacterium]
MDKKGFTLSELLATIVVLAIIMGLSLVAFGTVRENVGEKQYENLINYILNKGNEYANELEETETIYVSVDTLIEEGLIQADDDLGYIYDPRDHKVLNCYVLKIMKENGEVISEIDKEDLMIDEVCDETYVSEHSLKILCNNVACGDDWYGSNITLSIEDKDGFLENGNVEWSNLLGLKENAKTYTTNVQDSILQTTFTAVVNANKIYRVSKSLKIDIEKPVVKIDDYISTAGESGWMKEKSLRLAFVDQGAGIEIAKICETTSSTCTPNQTLNLDGGMSVYNFGNSATAKRICVNATDKVGNVSETYCSNAFKVDNSLPSVSVTTNYTTTVKFSLSDTISGLKSYSIASSGAADSWQTIANNPLNYSFNKTMVDGNYVIKVKDVAGNVKNQSFVVFVDTEGPTFKVNKATSWVTTDNISVTITDSKSGVVGYNWTTTDVAPSTWTSVTKKTSYDVTNSLTENKTIYLWAKDDAGNVNKTAIVESFIDREAPSWIYTEPSDWSNQNRTITLSASDVGSGVSKIYYKNSNESSYTEYTKPFVNTTGLFYVKVVDKVGNTKISGSPLSAKVDKDKPYTASINIDKNLELNPDIIKKIECETNSSTNTGINKCTFYRVFGSGESTSTQYSVRDYSSNSTHGVSGFGGARRICYDSEGNVIDDVYSETGSFEKITYNAGHEHHIYVYDKAGNVATNPLIMVWEEYVDE